MDKYASGLLCQDKDEDGYITFFCGCNRSGVCLNRSGVWTYPKPSPEAHIELWTPEEWKKEYSLTPPGPGKCFLVDIEL